MSVELSDKQIDYLLGSFARVNFTEGSIRSGKTIVTLLRWLFYIAEAPHGGELVMVGRTRDAVWRNCIAPLQNPALFEDQAAQVVGNYGAPTVKILGRMVHILGASDAKAEKVIRGMTVAGAYVDEATTLPEEFFTQLLGRMSVPGARMFVSTNPDNPAHYLRRKFLDRLDNLPDWRSWHFTLEDNPSLTEEYKASIRSEFTGLWFRRFINGEWVAAEGSIYDTWDPDTHVIPWDDLPPMQRLLGVGMDYGTTNPTSAILLGLADDGTLYAIDEWRHDPAQARRRLSDREVSARLRDWLAEQHLPYPSTLEPEWIFLDPSAGSLKVQLEQDGERRVLHADNQVRYGIRTVASLLATNTLHVTDRCDGLISEIPAYAWDPKATEKGEDRPLKVADHSADALRYAVTTTETIWRPWIDDHHRRQEANRADPRDDDVAA